VLFHVTVVVRNTGDVLLSLVWSQTRVQQVLPLIPQVMASIDNCENFVDDAKIHDPRIEIGWCQLGSHRINFEENQCDIEPGESEEIHHDFKLDPGVNTIAVYTYVKNRARDKHDLGWNLTTFQDLGDTAGTSLDEGGNKSNGEERIDCAEGDPGENPGVGRVTSSSEARDRTGPTS
ncbi:MAG: hypothetical protein M1358_10650, partial [Chloroflexi bacterium]|nr:hypothetical protein [Chloroflexota bacterium]